MATSFVNATVIDVGTSGSTVFTSTSGKAILIGCNVANKTGGIVPISLSIHKQSGEIYIVKDFRVGNGENAELMKGNKLVLQSGDSLVAKAALDASFDVIASILTGVA